MLKYVDRRLARRGSREPDRRGGPRARNRGRRIVASVTSGLVGIALAPAALMGGAAQAAPVGQGFELNDSDLRFILKQIRVAERHVATATPDNPCRTMIGGAADQIPSGPQAVELPWGLRTVDGSCNNLLPGQDKLGAADQTFRRLTTRQLRAAQDGTTYNSPSSAMVIDRQPRVVSNLVVDQTKNNPAARAATEMTPEEITAAGDREPLTIPNVAPDVGLSAPFNSVFTLFGQFFDHGLDLVTKGGNIVFMPLQADDPLIAGDNGVFGDGDDLDPQLRFMVLTRTQDVNGQKEAMNTTTPFVDQNQTYTSHPSHQVFLRDYAMEGTPAAPVATGHLLEGSAEGGMATWDSVQEQAATKLGIRLGDRDVLNVPLLATDQYGEFVRGPNGFPQVVVLRNGVRGTLEGDPTANGGQGVSLDNGADDVGDDYSAVRTGHAFLDDIAHHAAPVGDGDFKLF
jgi:hypothetical protein